MQADAEDPLYDDSGINLADPADKRGQKTRYISQLQIEAIRQVLDGKIYGSAVDVGCGFGRMSRDLASLGFEKVIGIDPSERVVAAARAKCPEIEFRVGGLPSLPLQKDEVQTIFILNVVRALHLMDSMDALDGVPQYAPHGGRVLILDNLRKGHADYIDERDLVGRFEAAGLKLVRRIAIRRSRWPWVILVRYGWFPERWHSMLVKFELTLMRGFQEPPRFQYANVIWMFEKK